MATGAIAHGVLVAELLDIPFVYVRASSKKHGLTNMIEGVLEPNQTVVVIEDLVSTGGSSLKAVEALRNAGCKVKGMAAIFSYGFTEAEKNFEENKVTLITLTDYESLMKKALEINFITEKDIPSLNEWRKNPQKWGE